MSNISDISKALKSARRAVGHTQADAARAIGVTVSAIRQWEQGRRSPLPLYREKVEEYINDDD